MKTFRKTFVKSFIKKKPLKASSKAQSAMEYLMTYGWAILIIAVVLAALFQLGVFNPMTFAPKAPPGACQVFRPNGPYTTSFINLEGICSGELPQYVAQFNGQSSYISGSGAYAFPLTATAWVDPISYYQTADLKTIMEFDGSGFGSGAYQFFIVPQGSGYCGGVGGRLYLWNPSASICTTSTIPLNTWTFLAFTTNSTNMAIYVNGQEIASGGSSFVSASADTIFIIGMQNCCGGRYFNGSLANVQLYNTSLSANEIQALYLEGIGGAPIDLQHLIAWWPLNGNANDYSGNGNNGQTTNVNFVGNWYSDYTPP